MDKTSLPLNSKRDRRNERGAALITTLLFSMLLLAAGGAVIVTTSLAGTTAIDTTAEMQAYYAAEAGLQASLNVLRGNDQATNTTTLATFRNVMNNPNLSGWLTYTSGRVTLSATSAFDITVTDPDNTDAALQPNRLIVRSTGYGPKGAVKKLELMISRRAFNFTPPGTVTIRSSDTSTAATTVTVGNSQPHTYSGNDAASPPQPSLPAFVVTNSADGGASGAVRTAVNGDISNITGSSAIAQLNPASLSAMLQNANNARSVLSLLESLARQEGRYFNTDASAGTVTQPTSIGSEDNPEFTFVNGNLSLQGNPGRGGGLLVVTGTLTMGGSSSWHGLVLVLGEGNMQRNGTPDLFGSVVVASFSRTGTGGFTAPTFQSDGGGNSKVQYDSEAVNNALNLLGSRVLGVREY